MVVICRDKRYYNSFCKVFPFNQLSWEYILELWVYPKSLALWSQHDHHSLCRKRDTYSSKIFSHDNDRIEMLYLTTKPLHPYIQPPFNTQHKVLPMWQSVVTGNESYAHLPSSSGTTMQPEGGPASMNLHPSILPHKEARRHGNDTPTIRCGMETKTSNRLWF